MGLKMTKKLKLPALHIAQQKVWEGRARYNVVCLGRRSGKTALGIMLALGASGCCDLAMGALQGVPVGWFAPTYKVLDLAWRESKQRLNPIITNKNEQSKRLEIMGGGTIDFWSLEDEDAGRGRKYARVIIDEAGIAKRLQPTWENAIRPTLTDLGGDAWFLSTPKGRNYFYDCYQRGINNQHNWASWQMPTACNPFINPAEIEEARLNLPERTFQQEYLAQFLDDAGGVFRNIRACTYEIKGADWWRAEQKQNDGRAYVIGVDLARVEDFTVITVVDARDRKIVAIDRFNQVEYVMQLERLVAMSQRFKGAPILIESNNTGIPFIELAHRRGLPVRPFQTTNASKSEIIEKLAIAFEQGTISIPDYEPLINELMCFDQERLAGGSIRYSAPHGQHDDTVMSLAIAWHGAAGMAQSSPISSTTRRF
jgi:hypothetical protein